MSGADKFNTTGVALPPQDRRRSYHISYTVEGSGPNPDSPHREKITLTFAFSDYALAVAAQEYGRARCPEWHWVLKHHRLDSLKDFIAEVDYLRGDFDMEKETK